MSITAKLAVAETALQAIATGGIAGEPNNARDTLAIVRDIAKEALCGIDPRYVEWFKDRDIRVDAFNDAIAAGTGVVVMTSNGLARVSTSEFFKKPAEEV